MPVRGNFTPNIDSVGIPKQHPFKKQPILPIAWPNITDGVTRSANFQKDVFLSFENTTPAMIPPKIPPCIATPPSHILNIDNGDFIKTDGSKNAR